MRRPRAGDERSSRTRAAPGLRPAANTGCLPGAWLTVAVIKRRPRKARPGAVRKTSAMARREAPAFSRGNAASQEQWLRHLARHLPRLCEGQRKTGLPGASTKNTGDQARPDGCDVG